LLIKIRGPFLDEIMSRYPYLINKINTSIYLTNGGIRMKELRLLVGCTKFPNMGDGQIGFAINRKEDCMEPHYPYQNGDANGYIHIQNHEELATLAKQIGAMTKAEFFSCYNVGPKDSWKNDYIRYLDKEIQ
jgi:hypothetical protein